MIIEPWALTSAFRNAIENMERVFDGPPQPSDDDLDDGTTDVLYSQWKAALAALERGEEIHIMSWEESRRLRDIARESRRRNRAA